MVARVWYKMWCSCRNVENGELSEKKLRNLNFRVAGEIKRCDHIPENREPTAAAMATAAAQPSATGMLLWLNEIAQRLGGGEFRRAKMGAGLWLEIFEVAEQNLGV